MLYSYIHTYFAFYYFTSSQVSYITQPGCHLPSCGMHCTVRMCFICMLKLLLNVSVYPAIILVVRVAYFPLSRHSTVLIGGEKG